MDGTIPRGALPKALARIRELSEKYGLRCANVFHAGDGNLHPLILYDANQPGEMERAEAFGADILRACVELGGVLTGEHGVGIEKRDLMGEMPRMSKRRCARRSRASSRSRSSGRAPSAWSASRWRPTRCSTSQRSAR
jgi:FAD/FMN-containing dehydrogenase